MEGGKYEGIGLGVLVPGGRPPALKDNGVNRENTKKYFWTRAFDACANTLLEKREKIAGDVSDLPKSMDYQSPRKLSELRGNSCLIHGGYY